MKPLAVVGTDQARARAARRTANRAIAGLRIGLRRRRTRFAFPSVGEK
jgi:hypothetical protein